MTTPQGVHKDVTVPMRDGVKLAADIFVPIKNGKLAEAHLPVILVRTSYNKEAYFRDFIDFFVAHEYAVVIQDVRGRYKSEGSFYHGVHEADDGYDTIEWIAQQPFCNGKIGMTGLSYLAAVQQAACCTNPPHLTSIFHVQAPSDYYQNGFRHAGAFLMYTVSIALMMLSSTKAYWTDPILQAGAGSARMHHLEWLSAMPLKPGLSPLSLADPDNERWFFDMMTHTDYGDFWKQCTLWQPLEQIEKYKDVPSYYVGGWYDLYREESFYTALSKRKKEPIKLLIGPWLHGGIGSRPATYAGDVEFGPEAKIENQEYYELQLKWFDQTLKGKNSGIYEEPAVKIFVMGGGDGRKAQGRLNHGGKWRLEKDWPLARAQNTKYYFHHGGLLSPSEPQGQAPSTYIYDPRDPAPTIGGTSYFNPQNLNPQETSFVPWGPYDQRQSPRYFGCKGNLPLSSRSDVLVYMTPPLPEDTEVTGPLVVNLWASSSTVDTDFTAKLIDLYPANEDYPEGYAMNLSDSMIRARYRNGFDKSELMKPGEIYEFTIDMPPTSNLFAKGHRIVVHISSSNYPTYDPNPNNGDPYFVGEAIVARNTIFHDRSHPSHIVLPLIRRNA
jgi:putative CocE/NonD family hydrolase